MPSPAPRSLFAAVALIACTERVSIGTFGAFVGSEAGDPAGAAGVGADETSGRGGASSGGIGGALNGPPESAGREGGSAETAAQGGAGTAGTGGGGNEAGFGGGSDPTLGTGGTVESSGPVGGSSTGGGAGVSGDVPEWACQGSPPVCNRSCSGMLPTACQGHDCCESPVVDVVPIEDGPTTSFRLDRYEVTVGRLRKYVDAFPAWHAAGNPVAGSGAYPGDLPIKGLSEPGWDPAWDSRLGDGVFSGSSPSCNGDQDPESNRITTLTEAADDRVPANCVNWAHALAFCIWDGGRLPSNAEWLYAAGNGPLHSPYPWGEQPVLADDETTASYAVYGGLGFADILAVGSAPSGENTYGQLDMVGSMAEWLFGRSGTAKFEERVYAGGSWSESASHVTSTSVLRMTDRARLPGVGFRCARDL